MDLSKINLSPLYTALRYVGSASAGAIAVGLATHVVNDPQAHTLTDQIGIAVNSVKQIAEGVQSLVGALAVIGGTALAAYGSLQSTLSSRTKAVVAASSTNAAPVMQALIESGAAKSIVATSALADATESPKIQSENVAKMVSK